MTRDELIKIVEDKAVGNNALYADGGCKGCTEGLILQITNIITEFEELILEKEKAERTPETISCDISSMLNICEKELANKLVILGRIYYSAIKEIENE